MPPKGVLKPFQLLEVNIISAQDLEPVSKKMKTYASAWVHPTRKLTTGVDAEGGNNPTWNDKFVFRVDDEFLRQDTSAVQIDIFSVHWFRDSLVGSVRVLVGNLIPPPTRLQQQHHIGMRFVALQIRRPSGRPQGILNIGVTLLGGTMRSMPLYRQLSMSAVGYRDLMDEDADLPNYNEKNIETQNNNKGDNNNTTTNNNFTALKPILRRTRSERSERVTFDSVSMANSSLVAVPLKKKAVAVEKESSILSISFEPPKHMMKKKGKASSVISGAELREKPKTKDKKGKSGSVLSDSIVSKESSSLINRPKDERPKPKDNNRPKEEKPKLKLIELELGDREKPTNEKKTNGTDSPTTKAVDEKSVTIKPKSLGITGDLPKEKQTTVIGKPMPRNGGFDYGGPKGLGPGHNGKFVFGGPFKAHSMWSDSEVGPSPSEVAAAMAEKKYPLEEEKSSVLDGWSLDESVEGLRSKLERWRTELPPLYDRGMASSSYHSTGRHTRRHTDGGSGLFSCFGNFYGYECQCICGKPKRKSMNPKFQSPSVASRSWV
ncbi:uncharacterized protein LOC132602630 [Lycium barbarum]|uniref:uncharacterized protein LOC132602630 n=1 Tax=Lycium barbarum TaxID=112863 RepID=UPI00293F6848|nr:uncharacterized protein LOC132602630 [Lycium barbarum]